MSTTDEREAYQGDEQDFRHKQSLRTDAATTHNGASVKRCARGSHGWGDRNCTNPVDPKVSPHWCPTCEAARRAHITKSFEALMAKIEAADRLAEQARLCIEQGEPERYLREALATYRNTAPYLPTACEADTMMAAATARPAAEVECADWCPVCGGKDGQHLHGCEDGSEVL